MQMHKKIVRFLRQDAILRALRNGGELWAFSDPLVRDACQLSRLNQVWRDAYTNIPFYGKWKERYGLPDVILSLSEYAKWPILRKHDLQEHPDLLKRTTSKSVHWSVTGGSTGEPLHFGTFPEQGRRVSMCMLTARAALGLLPGDRVFLFWGHRHFYGHGLRSKMRFFIRRCKDYVNNSYRADACDLSQSYLESVGEKLRGFKPEAIIAYSASLLVFCRNARVCGNRFDNLGIRLIICTAGGLSTDERREISTCFGAPVYMEYGSMDAGQMAYMTPEGRYQVFQNMRMLHTYNDGVGDLNLVTSLTEDYLPFFRYEIGDYLKDCIYTDDGRVLTIGEVWGRGSDVITLPSGNRVQAYAFMVLAEENAKILAYQVVRRKARLEVRVQTVAPLTVVEREHLFDKAYSIIAELRMMDFDIVEESELVKAPSGKIRLLVDLSGDEK